MSHEYFYGTLLPEESEESNDTAAALPGPALTLASPEAEEVDTENKPSLASDVGSDYAGSPSIECTICSARLHTKPAPRTHNGSACYRPEAGPAHEDGARTSRATRHTENVHQGLKNFNCDKCDKILGQNR